MADAIENVGIGFLFAPKFHPAIRNVASARRTIGIRSAFNIVGPLSNPWTRYFWAEVVGVFEPSLLETIANALQNTYLNEVMVVHAHDGFDELSNTCENDILLVNGKQIKRVRLHPKDVNIQVAKSEQLIYTF